MSEKITVMQETFKNGKSGEEVPGVTIIVDGKLRQVLDVLIQRTAPGSNYAEIVKDALFAGMEQLMRQVK